MNIKEKLDKYFKKRDFSRTPEPEGGQEISHDPPIFVIQKHKASRLHYDLRLEADGVLKSWAVPKGPSLKPSEKRLAMPTEDHPLEYAEFEGRIPEDEYGGGTMIIWDQGTYHLLGTENQLEKPEFDDRYKQGNIEFWLEGEKINGGFLLLRTGKDPRPRWLLIKKKDESANENLDLVSQFPASVKSRQTIEEMENRDFPG